MYDGNWLVVLPPEQLPGSLESLSTCVEQNRGTLTEALGSLIDADRREVIELARAARAAFERTRAPAWALSRIEADPAETPMNRENDKALYIRRGSGPAALALASSAAQAYMEFTDELATVGTDLAPSDVGRINQQFRVIFKCLCGWIPGYDLDQEAPLASSEWHPRDLDPLRRWVRGHHVFMVILQWQVILFQCFRRHVEQSGDSERGYELLKLLILSMRATLQAFRFAGEFTSDAYARVVRPTLMPPLAPEGMSGLNWRDHQFLLKSLTKLDSCFGESDLEMHRLYALFKKEVRTVYEGHKLVCARFVGTQTSLMSRTSAVSVIDRLKELRSRLL